MVDKDVSLHGIISSWRSRKRKDTDSSDDEDATPRPISNGHDIEPPTTTINTALNLSSEYRTPALSIQDVLRQRKALPRRRAGIEFTTDTTETPNNSRSLREQLGREEHDAAASEIERLIARFAPQTGHVAEANDKHM